MAEKPRPVPAPPAPKVKGKDPFIVMVNPKTLDVVEMFRQGDSYRLAPFGKPDKCIGNAYTAEEQNVGGDELVRIHSPGTCTDRGDFAGPVAGVNSEYRGEGYGLLLYAGTAAGVFIDTNAVGVFSIEGNRSDSAEKLWGSLVKSGIAKEVEVEGEPSEEETNENVCCQAELPDSGYQLDRRGRKRYEVEICEDVDFYKESKEGNPGGTYTTIDGEDMLNKPFVLWSSKHDATDNVPGDLIVRAKVANRTAAHRLGDFIRDKYGEDLYQTFMARPDILELFGQGRLPGVSGPTKSLPPLSAKSRELIALFDKAPDVGADLEGARPRRPRRERALLAPAPAGLSGPVLGDRGARRRGSHAGYWVGGAIALCGIVGLGVLFFRKAQTAA